MARGILKAVNATWDGVKKLLRLEHNKLVDEVDELKTNYAALLAKLDADAGVTDTDYLATLANSAAEASKVGVQ